MNTPSSSLLLSQTLHTRYPHNTFAFEASLAAAPHNLKLSLDAQLCPAYLASLQGGPPCPLGAGCPLRHIPPSSQNFRPPARDPHRRTVCKHWLRGLCKKVDACDYLHEYDMRRMPECRFFATFGFCNQAEECLYLHVEPASKRRKCERYERGFCPKGPTCEKKHVRRPACPLYIAGFCPSGKECLLGHPKTNPPSAASRASSPIQTHRPMTLEEAFGQPHGERRYATGGGGGGFGGDRDGGGGGRGGRGGGRGGYGGDRGGDRGERKEPMCFKCGEMGHFANQCPNPARPGNRNPERGPVVGPGGGGGAGGGGMGGAGGPQRGGMGGGGGGRGMPY